MKLLNDLDFAWELPTGSRPPKEKNKIPGLLEQKWEKRYEELKNCRENFGDCVGEFILFGEDNVARIFPNV